MADEVHTKEPDVSVSSLTLNLPISFMNLYFHKLKISAYIRAACMALFITITLGERPRHRWNKHYEWLFKQSHFKQPQQYQQ